jgi:hypothetical protein
MLVSEMAGCRGRTRTQERADAIDQDIDYTVQA